MKTLLHVCCAPCANQCIDVLRGDGLEVSFTPAYGIRRSFGRLWFHEITFGPKIGITTEYGLFLAPHIQYRIGLAF